MVPIISARMQKTAVASVLMLLFFSVFSAFPVRSLAQDRTVPDSDLALNPLWGNQDLTYLNELPSDVLSPDLLQEFQTVPLTFPICDPPLEPYVDEYDPGSISPGETFPRPPVIRPPIRCFPSPLPPFVRADLALSKQVDKSAVQVGETVNYTLTYRNNGPDFSYATLILDQYDAVHMTINDDTLPSGCYDIRRSGATGYIACRFFELLQPGQSKTLTYSAVATSVGTAPNTARVYSFKTVDLNLANNVSSVAVTINSGTPSADLRLTESTNVDTVALGGTLQYTLSYKNNGSSAATNVTIFDDYDEGLLTAINNLTAPCFVETTVSGKRIRCDLGTLNSGQQGIITYTASTAGAASGQGRNLSRISSNIPDPNQSNNTAVTVFRITKPVVPGDLVYSELMWMGSSAGTNDEWLELRNVTPFFSDISRLVLTQKISATTEQVLSVLPAGTILPPYGHYLIARHAAQEKIGGASSLGVSPDLIETGLSLNDSNQQFKIYQFNFKVSLPTVNSTMTPSSFPSLVVIDTAGNGGNPLAGSNGVIKASMIRKWQPGDGTVAASWMTAGIDETRGFLPGATDRGSPGIGNFPKVVVSAIFQGSEQVMVQNEYGEVMNSFVAFKSGTADGVNLVLGDTAGKDGSSEIVATKNSGGNEVIQTMFDGTRLLIGARDFFPAPNSASGLNVAACDFDKTGFKDYVVLGKKNNGNQVLIYKTDGTFVRSFTAFSKGAGVEVACGDIDKDKDDEILVGKGSGGTEAVLYEPSGTQIRYFSTFSKGAGMNVALADIDGDGAAEVIVGKKTGGKEVVLYKATGTQIRYFIAGSGSGDGSKVAAVDLDNDGKNEIVAARNSGGNQIFLFKADGTLLRNFSGIPGASGMNVGAGTIVIP